MSTKRSDTDGAAVVWPGTPGTPGMPGTPGRGRPEEGQPGTAGAARLTRRRHHRRLGLLALGAPAGLLGACAPAGGGEAGPAPQADLRGTTVEYWLSNAATHPEEVAKVRLLEEFSAQNPQGVRVTTNAPAPGNIDAHQKTIAASAAGTPPTLVSNWNMLMSDYFHQGATVDVDAELKGSADWRKYRPAVYPNILSGLSWKGKLFAVPAYNSFFQLYYQPELLKKAGLATPPPRNWTWEQFVDYGRRGSQPPEVTGYDDQWSYSRTGMMALNNGARFMSADGTKFLYSSPELLETVEWQLGLVRQGLMRAHDGSAGGGYAELLPQAKVLFQLAVAARVTTYRNQGTQFGTCWYPLGPKNTARAPATHGEAYGFAVFKHKDPKAVQGALLAALWAASPASGTVIAEVAGTVPSYKHTVEDAAFQTKFKADAERWPFYEILPGFVPLPNFPGFVQVRSEIVDGKLKDVWAGRVSPRDGLNEMTRLGQERLDQALKGT